VALGKEAFADEFFVVYSLPNAALGKAFAEGKIAFAACVFSSEYEGCK
jgi:peptidoglycan biosynthesis protein MviN/MurJ (putative lipid II flippase)